uniref:Secreted protein n=1 Tax=Globisporangium ultimum (strain ATCC 200006 / CBS 805.95 / DAOM BR144) TaxID=431595 RepID=K3WHG4_GLOUD
MWGITSSCCVVVASVSMLLSSPSKSEPRNCSTTSRISGDRPRATAPVPLSLVSRPADRHEMTLNTCCGVRFVLATAPRATATRKSSSADALLAPTTAFGRCVIASCESSNSESIHGFSTTT